MNIVNEILSHSQYTAYMELNAQAEKDRLFCKHDYQHVFDVARVAYIMSLERKSAISKEIVYAAALLHDIAKWEQYQNGTDHALKGAILAKDILKDIGVGNEIIEEVTDAIRTHRKKDIPKSFLGNVLYDSDKACRPCIFCKSIDGCKKFIGGKKPDFEY